jgi:predicted kinase
VVVTGPPASGKSTLSERLAREFRLPLITKDGFKEVLLDALGVGDLDWSRRLGSACYPLIFYALEGELAAGRSALVEANFHRAYGSERFAELRARQRFSLLQIHCSAPFEVLAGRYRDRAISRHPGHVDTQRLDGL